MCRFATSAYHEPNSHNTANVFMHLTNYAVNKHSRTFIVDEEAGSKRQGQDAQANAFPFIAFSFYRV